MLPTACATAACCRPQVPLSLHAINLNNSSLAFTLKCAWRRSRLLAPHREQPSGLRRRALLPTVNALASPQPLLPALQALCGRAHERIHLSGQLWRRRHHRRPRHQPGKARALHRQQPGLGTRPLLPLRVPAALPCPALPAPLQVYPFDLATGTVAAYRVSDKGLELVWEADQRTSNFFQLIGPPERRVLVGTQTLDLPDNVRVGACCAGCDSAASGTAAA